MAGSVAPTRRPTDREATQAAGTAQGVAGGAAGEGKSGLLKKVLLPVGMIVFGSATILLAKSELALGSIDMYGEPRQFKRPLASAAAPIISFALIEPLAALFSGVSRLLKCHRPSGDGSGSSERSAMTDLEAAAGASGIVDGQAAERVHGVHGNASPTGKACEESTADPKSCRVSEGSAEMDATPLVFKGLVPAVMYVITFPLQYVAMLSLPASIWQTLRFSSIVFSAILRRVFLHCKLQCFEWFGVFMCFLGVLLVGLSNLLTSETTIGDPSEVALACGLLVLSQFFAASALISEEYLIKKCNIPPLRVLSLEGLWGIFLLALVYSVMYVLPGGDYGHIDDFFDTIALLENSGPLIIIYIFFVLAFAGFMYCGIMISAMWSAIHRRMLDLFRSAVIWVIGLVVHHCISVTDPLAEAWTEWSCFELFGFIIIAFGQLMFSGVLPRLWRSLRSRPELPH